MTPREIIKREYPRGLNVMTPELVEYGALPWGAYELSKGTGISGGVLYGVTVVRYDPATGRTERAGKLSTCFDSLRAAREHIEALRIGRTLRRTYATRPVRT